VSDAEILSSGPIAPVPVSEAVKLLRSRTESQKSFQIGTDGSVSFAGYTPDEVKTLLTVYRNHLKAMAQMAREAPLPDAFRSTGGGYS